MHKEHDEIERNLQKEGGKKKEKQQKRKTTVVNLMKKTICTVMQH